MKILKVGPDEYWKVPHREMRDILKKIPEGASVEFVDALPDNCVVHDKTMGGQVVVYKIDVKKRNAQYQQNYRTTMIAAGFKQVTVWVKARNVNKLKRFAEDL